MGARGERTIALPDGSEVHVLYTNWALANIEQVTDRSIIAVADGFSLGKSGMREIAAVLQAGMEAHRRDAREGGRTITLRDAYEVLDEVGFATVAAVTMEAVGTVLGYGVEGEFDEEMDDDPNA